jgi:TolA-binding protein
MNPKVKLVLYIALLGVMAWLVVTFRATLNAPDEIKPPASAGTNSMSESNALVSSNALVGTNVAAAVTNQIASTNTAAAAAGPEDLTARKSSKRMGRLMAHGVGMFFTLIALSLLLAQDLSRFFGNRVEEFIFNDNLEGVKDPEYEEAEKVWAGGNYLDAIQLMRDYLKKNPREQYVALRIAEIYESNLGNYLAAALEYEEVLKKKLRPERWGWAAIHLANLYSGKLSKTEEATKLLRRIVDEYGQTGAAKKARERLGIPEPVEAPPEPEPEPEPAPRKKTPEPPPSNLPPGFRPK